ncbi:hypothetical protein BDA96_08G084000 [Sorghum bicolor]|uniref:Uncharacterized protein n=2 Tax=Sorghum bicolor TaxID=4558 RepID=A0A921QHG2_SORBI|nr:uncharacterized protein LOC110429943 [Sorghum bicolor]KAG0520551.1 hypothetical protein BDA96_08G084000 [Sorghum bicolor]KXG23285.1 hypothetical protein SORBI_3008G078700 [Sorghum bicolor]|eukprot:XP_021302395.1 uncharacterized protein LOC110429943 [Sorghum bicolor]
MGRARSLTAVEEEEMCRGGQGLGVAKLMRCRRHRRAGELWPHDRTSKMRLRRCLVAQYHGGIPAFPWANLACVSLPQDKFMCPWATHKVEDAARSLVFSLRNKSTTHSSGRVSPSAREPHDSFLLCSRRHLVKVAAACLGAPGSAVGLPSPPTRHPISSAPASRRLCHLVDPIVPPRSGEPLPGHASFQDLSFG